jgi:tetratricopeptide (TPR) repeat protein
MKKLEEALHCFEKAIAIDKHFAKAFYNKGLLLTNLTRYP